MNTEAVLQFLQENWLIIAIAVVVLFLIVSFVKTVLKWVLVIGIIVGIAIYGGYTINDISKVVSTVTDVDKLKDEAMKLMASEAKDAKYTMNEDGTFTVETPSKLVLTGKPGADKVDVTFRGISLGEWSVSGAVKTLIDGAGK
ncbi:MULTISPECIES: hypothetical protein [unclassified Paenibacillus]|uniref:hypothetical protein n=1 Tax=unclassified Paenibacillus TaxID=185978 RepID=UPI001C0F8A1E|nr:MULTISPECIES: hypothetical protein [unclassified Paenibacillus]MBU5441451.1 hypothetical protein [Paenibacillus sp. MSJ-34]CAH0118320.1 hypothetical protein PAE9249_00806 [Paenibacillus sp. CECT 9249]